MRGAAGAGCWRSNSGKDRARQRLNLSRSPYPSVSAMGLAEDGLIAGIPCAELADDESLFESGEDGFDGGGLEQTRALPPADPRLAKARNRAKPAGDGHHHDVRLGTV
jgi:hypothetical protein